MGEDIRCHFLSVLRHDFQPESVSTVHGVAFCQNWLYCLHMSDEITIDGEQFVSSKRASEISGYKQDYIGQLSRGGQILARRVGGLWYISSGSLIKYKERAEEYRPVPPVNSTYRRDTDALLSFDGRGYLSASRAAKLTGYSPDYVGQMARAGIIPSRQVGNRWYVEQTGILSHKKSKDALLAAVQVESVGLKSSMANDDIIYSHLRDLPLYRYTTDKRELMPSTGADHEPVGPSRGKSADYAAWPAGREPLRPVMTAYENVGDEVYDIPIRVYHNKAKRVRKTAVYIPVAPEPKRSMLPVVISASLLTIVIVLSLGFISFRKSSIFTDNMNNNTGSMAQMAGAGMALVSKVGDLLEPILSAEIIYQRSE
jgi:hypothetical protein